MAGSRRPEDSAVADAICVGAVAGAHGVRGGVRIKPFTQDPEAVGAYGMVRDESGARRFEIQLIGKAKGVVLAKLSGVETREAAEALKGMRLYVDRATLPPSDRDEFYHTDLIGLAVELADGGSLGIVHALHDFGAGDLLEVKTSDGKLILLPFTEAVFPTVDLEAGRIVARPPPGLIDNGNDDDDDKAN